MQTFSTYVGALAVLAVTACGDADPAAREQANASSPPAVGSGSQTVATTPDSNVSVAEAVRRPSSAGSKELASGAIPANTLGRTAPSTPAAAPPAREASPPTVTAPDAEAVLRRAERAYDNVRSMEAEFTQAVTVPLLESTQHSRGKLFIRRPDRFLMRFSQPEGDIVVADGSYFWMYYPSTDPKQVMRASVGDGSRQVDLQKEFLSNPTERYNAVLGPVEAVDGRPAQVVVLTPKARSGYRRVRIWVDREDALVRRFEITEENESLRRLDLRGLRTNVTLGDQMFRFTPPPGTQVFTQ